VSAGARTWRLSSYRQSDTQIRLVYRGGEHRVSLWMTTRNYATPQSKLTSARPGDGARHDAFDLFPAAGGQP